MALILSYLPVLSQVICLMCISEERNKIQKGKTCYSEEQVISMLEFLIDNIFVSFGGTLFQQVVGFCFKRVFNLSCGRVVYRVEKSIILMEDT
jgi:hypothetical protein